MMIFPFNRKKKEAEEIWRKLRDEPPKDAAKQLVDAVCEGDIEKQEKLFNQMIKSKMREILRDDTN